MLDFTKFAKAQEVIVPIVHNTFMHNRKSYALKTNVPDGWYTVSLCLNDAVVVSEHYIDSNDFANATILTGYLINGMFIASNLDVFHRVTPHKNVMVPLCFYPEAVDFVPVRVILWEDGRLYYCGLNYRDVLCEVVKSTIEADQVIMDMKGITPELKMVGAVVALEKQKVKEELMKLAQEQHRAAVLQSVQGRLMVALSEVGGSLLNYAIRGQRLTFDWEITVDRTRRFNSVIDLNTFRVIEAGYCMSGDDKSHSVRSMVLLAKDYEHRGVIHITRHNDSFDSVDDEEAADGF